MIARRQFIKLSLAASGALLVQIPLSANATERRIKNGHYFDAWLSIDPDNKLLFSLEKVEMGQGVINSLVTILAEEINTDPLTIDLQLPVVGSAQHNPLHKPGWGTGASASVRSLWPKLREAGAVLNQRMLIAAARRWDTDTAVLQTRQAQVIDTTANRSLRFGELINDVVAIEDIGEVVFKNSSDYQWVGKQVPTRDMAAKATGTALYCADIQFEDVPVAVVIRCPYPKGRLQGYQWQPDKAPQDIQVLALGDRLVLVGSSYHRVNSARAAVNVEWQPGRPLPASNALLRQRLLNGLQGDVDTVFSKGDTGSRAATHSATYFVPYLAHAPLEPMNCTVLIGQGTWTVWAPTQKPKDALRIAVNISGLPADKGSVRTPFLGGGFGRRLQQDYVSEACNIAKQLGHSVKVLWSREDDFQHGYYRPAIAATLEANADAAGINDLLYRAASSEAGPRAAEGFTAGIQQSVSRWLQSFKGKPTLRNQAIEGVDKLAYAVDAQQIQLRFMDIGIPTALWRSVGHSFIGFFIESFIDELAWSFQRDPIDYRLQVLKDAGLQNVLRRVRKLSAWGVDDGVDTARGVACYRCFRTAVAMVVEVKAVAGALQVPRVWCAIDCGLAVDPDGVSKQVEGSVNFGLCAALFGELRLNDGRIASSNFHDYPVLKIQQAPDIVVDIVASDKPPTGVGEPATPLVAPALCNALFALTGERYRELPLRRQLQGKLTV